MMTDPERTSAVPNWSSRDTIPLSAGAASASRDEPLKNPCRGANYMVAGEGLACGNTEIAPMPQQGRDCESLYRPSGGVVGLV